MKIPVKTPLFAWEWMPDRLTLEGIRKFLESVPDAARTGAAGPEKEPQAGVEEGGDPIRGRNPGTLRPTMPASWPRKEDPNM